jgi:hypothetical protein
MDEPATRMRTRWRSSVQVGDLVGWTERNKRRVGIVIAFHSADPDNFRFWKVHHNGKTELRREEGLKVINASR